MNYYTLLIYWLVAMRRIESIAIIEEEFEKVNPDFAFRKNGMHI